MKKILSFAFMVMMLQVSAQQLITETEFELFGDHIFVSVSVDDSEPVDFIFDTGDGLAVLDLDIAKKLNLKPDHQSTKTSAQGSISGSLIEHNKIEINDVKLEEIELYTTDLSHLEQTIGRNIDGIIGYDLLKNYVVKIDYQDMKIKLYDTESFNNPGYVEKFSFKLIHYIPTVQATVTLNNGESYTEDFFLNTGAGTTLDFNTPFAQKHDVISKTGEHYSYPVAGLEDKETMHYEGRIRNFSIGTFNMDQLPIGISQAEHGIQHNKKVAGIIGNGVLKHFNITLDYSRNEMFLEANKNFENPYLVNASGINLQFNKDLSKLLIHRVFEGSPADIAGIKVDAQLLSIDGKSVDSFTLPEIRESLKQANKQVKLTYLQDGIEKEATLDLDPLI